MPTPLVSAATDMQDTAADLDAVQAQPYNARAADLAKVSPKGAKAVLSALTPVLKEMGGQLQGTPSTLGDPEVARALAAVEDAVDDAIEAHVLDPQLSLHVDMVRDDQSAAVLAGKLSLLFKGPEGRAFNTFLDSPAPQKAQAPAPAAGKPPAPPADDGDSLLMSRMR